jgi:hypothetical protein
VKTLEASVAEAKKYNLIVVLIHIHIFIELNKIRCCAEALGCWIAKYVELVESLGLKSESKGTREKRGA